MKRRNSGQDGFAMLYVLMLMMALMLMLGAATAFINATHRQNVKDKLDLAAQAAKLNQAKP